MSLNSLQVRPLTYVLQCAPRSGCAYHSVYVGSSMSVNLRYAMHLQNLGSKWTREHKPSGIILELLDPGVDTASEVSEFENEVTLRWMRTMNERHGKDGWRSVRGGKYCKLCLARPHGL